MLCADVFGYSRLMGENEEATLRALPSHRKLVASPIEQHRGRCAPTAGDGVLASVARAGSAAQSAAESQTETAVRCVPNHRRGAGDWLAVLAPFAAVIVFVQPLSLRPRTTTASIPPEPSPGLTLPDKPSMVVLPFVNMSGDRDQEYFS